MSGVKHETSSSELMQEYIARKVKILEDAYMKESPWAIRQLAQLRRASGKDPGTVPEIWTIEFDELPRNLVGHGSEPSPGEWAAHIALTLYASHQQSQSERMHVPGRGNGFGAAVRRLVAVQGERSVLENGQMPRRLAAMVTAQSIRELSHYARQLVGLLRAHAIPVDYGLFGKQIYLFQFPGAKDSICLQWAREYTGLTSLRNQTSS